MIGKPYSGKPNVRFDEGELEIELLATTPALYSTLFEFYYGSPCNREFAGHDFSVFGPRHPVPFGAQTSKGMTPNFLQGSL